MTYLINYSGRRDFPFVVMTQSGTPLAYFNHTEPAKEFCDSQAATMKAEQFSPYRNQ